jgi:hypothetical protein
MKNLIAVVALLVTAGVGAKVASASQIPPHVDVVTRCGQVEAVYVAGVRTTGPVAKAFANKVPQSAWVEAGCKR